MRVAILSRRHVAKLAALSMLWVVAGSVSGCEDTGKVSAQKARAHMDFLDEAIQRDVAELRRGMPQGAKALESLFREAAPEVPAAVDARKALKEVRAENDDLDSAKSTFFLVATADGTILRNNLDQDDMAGKNLFEAYPEAKKGKKGEYTEFTGSWKVARGVNNRKDAQRCAMAPISLKGDVVGYFVSGWSWSSYAYRLETTLRSEVLQNTKEGDKVPLLYVYVIDGSQAYGAPVAPVVNGEALVKLDPLAKTKGGEVYAAPIEIERRQFGVVMQHQPELGEDVVVAVLRSET